MNQPGQLKSHSRSVVRSDAYGAYTLVIQLVQSVYRRTGDYRDICLQ
jgi:hypothetical protein